MKAYESFDFYVTPCTALPELSYVYNFNWMCNHFWHVSVALTLFWEEQSWQPLKRCITLRDDTSIWTFVFVADSFKNCSFAHSTKWRLCFWTSKWLSHRKRLRYEAELAGNLLLCVKSTISSVMLHYIKKKKCRPPVNIIYASLVWLVIMSRMTFSPPKYLFENARLL